MAISIHLELPENLYLRNPEQTELGRNIIDHSIRMIDEEGLENFAFKKLARRIGSTEASIYRYFENKHKLLVYLIAWYWTYVEFMIDYQTHNVEDPARRLRFAIRVLTDTADYDSSFSHIDHEALHRIVVTESTKPYFTKQVNGENPEKLFRGYRNLCDRLGGILRQINPKYPNPYALATVLIDSSHQQIFFSRHFPFLTDIESEEGNTVVVADYLEDMAVRVLGKV